jgi:hypothetical protein
MIRADENNACLLDVSAIERPQEIARCRRAGARVDVASVVEGIAGHDAPQAAEDLGGRARYSEVFI